jgi:hypothetical protein
MKWRFVISTVCAIAMLAAALALAEHRSAAYLAEQTTSLERAIADYRSGAAQYRRPVVGAAAEGNAAVWYRLAFSELRNLPEDTVRLLNVASQPAKRSDPSYTRPLFRARCREASSSRVHEALRCARCDWEHKLGSVVPAQEASILGHCLVMTGDLAPHATTAMSAYFDALAFASDMAQADFIGTLVAMVVAKSAMVGISDLVTSEACTSDCLSDVSTKLTTLSSHVPNATPGVFLDALFLADAFQRESMDAAKASSGRFLPWRTLAAWRVSRLRPLVDDLLKAHMATPMDRERMKGRIGSELERNGLSSSKKAVGDWFLEMGDADDVARDFRAVQTAVSIEREALKTRRFADATDPLLRDLPKQGLRYERSPDGNGYSIVKTVGRNRGTAIVRHSR